MNRYYLKNKNFLLHCDPHDPMGKNEIWFKKFHEIKDVSSY